MEQCLPKELHVGCVPTPTTKKFHFYNDVSLLARTKSVVLRDIHVTLKALSLIVATLQNFLNQNHTFYLLHEFSMQKKSAE